MKNILPTRTLALAGKSPKPSAHPPSCKAAILRVLLIVLPYNPVLMPTLFVFVVCKYFFVKCAMCYFSVLICFTQ